MKNATVLINVLLAVAVAVLFYLHFSSKKTPKEPAVKSSAGNNPSNKDFRIAYFEMDSIENSFLMVKEVTKELSEKEQNLMNDLARMEKELYNKATEYQSKAGTMSQTESELATNDMAQRRKRFEAQKKRRSRNIKIIPYAEQTKSEKKIQDFLSGYNKTKGYSYIISNEPGFIFHHDTVYNITSDVIIGLNELYSSKK